MFKTCINCRELGRKARNVYATTTSKIIAVMNVMAGRYANITDINLLAGNAYILQKSSSDNGFMTVDLATKNAIDMMLITL